MIPVNISQVETIDADMKNVEINPVISIVASHNALLDRSMDDQHPIKAISGLQEALDKKQVAGAYLEQKNLQAAIDEALAQAETGGKFNGADGYSPIINVTEIEGGHRVSVIDAEGRKSFDIMNGKSTEIKEEIDSLKFVSSAAGRAIALSDSSDRPLVGLHLYGITTQDGTPEPENPVPLVSAGDGGKLDISITGKSLYSAEMLTGVQRVTVTLDHPLPPGEYVVSATMISDDTDAGYSLLGFEKGNIDGSNVNVRFDYGLHQSRKFRIYREVRRLFFNASSSLDGGVGDSCTWRNIQIEIGETGTSYEPHKDAQILSVSTPDGLKGIPVLADGNYTDKTGQQWLCDEIDFERGVYVQRVTRFGVEDRTSLKRGVTDAGVPYVDLYRQESLLADTPLLCSGYVQISTNAAGQHGTIKNYSRAVTVYDDRFSADVTDDEVLEMLDDMGFVVLVKRGECVETPLSAEEIEAYKALRTHRVNTSMLNYGGAWMDVRYCVDVNTYVCKRVGNPSGADYFFAPVKSAWEQRMLDRIDLAMIPKPALRRMAKAPSGYIQPGDIMTGIVYSSVWETVGNVGVHVPLSTYYSALENPASVMYTRDDYQGDTNKSTYYGITCSSFVSYAFGWSGEAKNCVALAKKYSDNVLDIKTEDDLFQIRRGDLILNTIGKEETGSGDHVKMVRDVVHDRATGRLIGFNVVEGTKPYVAVTFMSTSRFLKQMNEEQPYYVVRVPNDDYALEVKEVEYSHTVYPDRGDGGKYALGETVELYIPDMSAKSVYYSVGGGAESNIALSAMPLEIVNGVAVYRFTPPSAGTYSISANTHRDDPCTVVVTAQ